MDKQLILAGAIIKDNQGRVLLIHRNTPSRIQWEIPGGKVELGESYEQAAIRELKEELNVEIKVVKILGCESFEEDGYNMEYNWFLSEIVKGTPKLMESKFDDIRYFDSDELAEIQGELSTNTINYMYSQLDFKNRKIK